MKWLFFFVSQDYIAAHEDFQHSLELNQKQPIAVLYKGLTFFHRGLLKVIFVCPLCFLYCIAAYLEHEFTPNCLKKYMIYYTV